MTKAIARDPVVTLEWARLRHEFARNLLAHGFDPSALKVALGKRVFAATMREWESARAHAGGLGIVRRIECT